MYTLTKWTAQPLMGDRQPIAEYRDRDHVPFIIREALSWHQVAPFLGKLVTIAGQVPLDVLLHGGVDAVYEYISDKWFTCNVNLRGVEYRAIGASFEDFDEKANGYVHLQITCELAP